MSSSRAWGLTTVAYPGSVQVLATPTTDVPTIYMDLTTTFTQPADCSQTPFAIVSSGTRLTPIFFVQGGDNTASCFPPGFPFVSSKIVYSPGICPAGWTSACEKTDTSESFTQRIVSCCPRYVTQS